MIKYQIRVFICMGRFLFFNCLYLHDLWHTVYNEDTMRIVHIAQNQTDVSICWGIQATLY